MGLFQRISGLIADTRGLVRGVKDDTRGNVAMIVGLVMPVLVLVTMGGVDIHRLATVRANLQDALDAAALSAARSDYVRPEDLKRVGLVTLKANLAGYPNIRMRDEDVTFVLVGDEVVVADAKVELKTIAVHIFMPPYGTSRDGWLPVSGHSEVDRATKDIEVSLVLDITGSMGEGNRMKDLQAAAKELVDLVVQDNQDINSTRMALVPYSMGVNAGTYADAVRGAAKGTTNITAAGWMNGTQKTITAITVESNPTFTASNHGFQVDDFVWLSGITDKGENNKTDMAGNLNNSASTVRAYKVSSVPTTSTFKLQRWNGTAWANITTNNYQTYNNSGIARECQIVTCEVVVASAAHGLNTGDDVRISGVEGMTQINTQTGVSSSGSTPFSLPVTKLTDATFALPGWVGPLRTLSNYVRNGRVQCLEYGCQNFLFTNNSGALRVYSATKCVSERVGPNAYTDVAATTTPVSHLYVDPGAAVSSGGCMTTTFTPLTTDRAALKKAISDYVPEGGTAGQIGVGWGWYMISPTFASIFPSTPPQPYGTRNLLKVVIIMTDGEFNAVYYNGVRAKDSGTGGGTNDRWINQNSNNGNPFGQSAKMCDEMKKKNIIIYTVGFDITSTNNSTSAVDSAQDVMEYCASTPDHVFLPEDGGSLKSAFAAIGRSISQLRISA